MNLYYIKNDILIVDYEKFCDEKKMYESENNNFKEQAVTSLKTLHQAILKAFDNKMIVEFFQEYLKSEAEYREFLKENQDIYKSYIKLLKERNNYSIN